MRKELSTSPHMDIAAMEGEAARMPQSASLLD